MAQTRVGHHIEQLIMGTKIIEGGGVNHHPICPEFPITSWLDVGGGNGIASTTMELNFKVFHGEPARDETMQRKVMVDPKPWEGGTDWKKYAMLYDDECPIWKDHFDVISCLDTIEHVTKEEGNKWLDHFEETADRLIIIFTPEGFIPQGPRQSAEHFDKWEEHKSGWEVMDFIRRGYCVWRTPVDFHHNPTGVYGDWAAILAWKNFAI